MHLHLHVPCIVLLGVLAHCAHAGCQLFEQSGAHARTQVSLTLNEPTVSTTVNSRRTHQGPAHQVQWVRAFSSSSDFEAANTIWHDVSEILFGGASEQLVRPYGIFVLSKGECFILDQGRESLLRVDTTEGEIEEIQPDVQPALPSLVGICAYREGRLLVSDSRLNTLFVWTEDDVLSPFKTSVPLHQPTGIAWSPETKEIWVAETGLHRIAVLSEEGGLLRTIGGRGTGEGRFNFPTALCVHDDRCYVVDAMNFRIQVFDTQGRFVSTFGSQGNGTGYFAAPRGIACDSHGNIYVTDALFHTVQIFDREGRFLLNFGAQGRGDGEFWMPAGVSIRDDFIYIADSYNARIQVFQLIHREHEGR